MMLRNMFSFFLVLLCFCLSSWLFALDTEIPLPGDESIPLPGDESVPLPGGEGVPLPGAEADTPLSDYSVPPSSFPFDVRGYIENTTNLEYVKEEERILLLNAGRARLNLSGRPDTAFDVGLGLVGTLNVGETELSMLNYFPDALQEQIVPGAEEFFLYEIDREELYLQEAFGSLYAEHFWLRIGRHKFYSGTGYAYNPIDLFNVKDPLDPTYETDGIDALLLSIEFPNQTEIQGVMRFGEDFENTDYLARIKSYFHGWDLALQYNYYLKSRVDWEALNSEEALFALAQGASFDDFTREFRWHLIGGEFSGELFEWAVYGEGGYVFVDPLGDDGTLADAAQDHERVVLGTDHTFDSQVYLLLEYLRLGQGRTDSADIRLNDRVGYLSGELLSIDRDTLFSGMSYPTGDLTELSLYVIVGCNDPGAMLNPWLIYDLRPGLKLSFSANIPLGDEESQNGKAGPAGFVRLKWNF
ncbi:MAG: hypothetical protein GY801_43435 [bacterium]|nr:hypothetical protein [bacterium]